MESRSDASWYKTLEKLFSLFAVELESEAIVIVCWSTINLTCCQILLRTFGNILGQDFIQRKEYRQLALYIYWIFFEKFYYSLLFFKNPFFNLVFLSPLTHTKSLTSNLSLTSSFILPLIFRVFIKLIIIDLLSSPIIIMRTCLLIKWIVTNNSDLSDKMKTFYPHHPSLSQLKFDAMQCYSTTL